MYWYYVLCNLQLFFIILMFVCAGGIFAISVLDMYYRIKEKWYTKLEMVKLILSIIGILSVIALCLDILILL